MEERVDVRRRGHVLTGAGRVGVGHQLSELAQLVLAAPQGGGPEAYSSRTVRSSRTLSRCAELARRTMTDWSSLDARTYVPSPIRDSSRPRCTSAPIASRSVLRPTPAPR
ncbi:hypothetical protein NKH77_03660 [Streptomyces sp. M19]